MVAPAHEPSWFQTRRTLLMLMDVLRPLGLDCDFHEFVEALNTYIDRNMLARGGWAFEIKSSQIQKILNDTIHQEIIDRIAAAKDGTVEAPTYRSLYPQYTRACRKKGIKPVAFKTFQNRSIASPQDRCESRRTTKSEVRAKKRAARHRKTF